MAASQAEAFLGGMPIAVDPSAIDHVLRSLWEPLDASGASDSAMRVALGTLLVLASEAEAPEVAATCRHLATRYPSRVIVVLLGDQPGLSASVYATCEAAWGLGHQVCGETIVLRCGPDDQRRLAGVLLPLLLPDVLSTLWWARRDVPDTSLLRALLPALDRLLIDSSRSQVPRAALRWVAARAETSDLRWWAQQAWREAVAKQFDSHPAAAAAVDSVVIRWPDGEAGLVQGGLLGGWIAGQLGWQPSPGDDGRAWRQADESAATIDLKTHGTPFVALRSTTMQAEWLVRGVEQPAGGLQLVAHCRDWCRLPSFLPAAEPTTADCIAMALGRPVLNTIRDRAAAYAVRLLGD